MRSFRSYAPGQNSPVKSFLRTHQTAGCALKKKPDSPSAAADSLRLRVEKQSFSLELHFVCVFTHKRAEGILSHVCAAHFAGIVRLFVCASDSRLFLSGRCCTRCIVFSRRSRARGRCRCSYFSSQNDE
jgi:hypothetical protein